MTLPVQDLFASGEGGTGKDECTFPFFDCRQCD